MSTNWHIAGAITCANAIIIKDKSILLVEKGGVLILPGGKLKHGEDDHSCLQRELREELPGFTWDAIGIGYWRMFMGRSPHRDEEILVKTYLFDQRYMNLFTLSRTGAEISAMRWYRPDDTAQISKVTQDIVAALHAETLIA